MSRGIEIDGKEAEHLMNVSKAMVKKFNTRASSIDDINGHHLNLTDAEELKVLMREMGEVVDEDAIEGIVQTVLKKQKDVGKASFLKRRMDLDMSATVRAPNGKEISLYDLMETDAEKVLLRYLQKSSGLIGFARKGYGKERTLSSEIAQALKRVENEARSSTDPKVRKNMDKTIANLKHATDAIQGKPLDDLQLTPVGRGMRLLTDASFVRLMGQTGAASIPELAQSIGYAGVINAVRQFLPTLSKSLETIKKGDTGSETLSTELEAMGMFGGNSLNNQVSARFNDHDVEMLGATFKRIDAGLQTGKKLTVKYSGLALVTDWTQEVAARAMSQKFYNDALHSVTDEGFEQVWKSSWKRLHLYGLSKSNAKLIFDQIRTHAQGRPSTWMKTATLGRLNLKKWDKTVLDEFSQVMFRMTTHAVQEVDIGNLPAFMHKDAMRMIFQFRSFVAGAYAKSTLNGIHMRDTQAGVALVGSMALGWMSYVAQNTLNSIGRDDEWLDERMTTEKQLAASFSRSAFASLTPAFIDALLEAGGQDQLFNHSMSSGLTQLSIPAVDTVQAVASLGSTAISPLTPREITEGDMDGAMRLLSNLWILRNVTAAIDEGIELPKGQDN